jgi:hypothetical protein
MATPLAQPPRDPDLARISFARRFQVLRRPVQARQFFFDNATRFSRRLHREF